MIAVAPESTSAASDWIADYAAGTPPRNSDMARLSSTLDSVLAVEWTEADSAMGAGAHESLLAAFGRAVARTMGDGMLAVDFDVSGAGPGRVHLPCDSRRGLSGFDLLAVTRAALGVGVPPASPHAAVRVCDGRAGAAAKGSAGYLLILHAHRRPDSPAEVYLDWCYDTRSFDGHTVAELAEQFPLALIEVTSG
jgi:hypothetical protein